MLGQVTDDINTNGGDGAAEEPNGSGSDQGPVFEMIVLGSGGGPLETDCSGYLVKPYCAKWEDGIMALEGGSGLGALATLLETRQKEMFPNFNFPEDYNTAVFKAAYIFSYLTCYLVTHAHLDHTLSLIMMSGSVPPRPSANQHSQPPLGPIKNSDASESKPELNAPQARVPVYGTKETLERLSSAYGGGLWPELGYWANTDDESGGQRKRRRVVKPKKTDGCGVVLTPVLPSLEHRPLHCALPITTLTFPVAHGCTSHGLYESSAIFVRYDPAAIPGPETKSRANQEEEKYREFLFFGDVESEWRPKGDEEVGKLGQEGAAKMNKAIWEEAAKGWDRGRLAGIFIECSYDSARPASLMFGHISPPGLYHELESLASKITKKGPLPLSGLKVWVTHIKEALVPHPSGVSARERIMEELNALERERQLGVVFVDIRRGDRILI